MENASVKVTAKGNPYGIAATSRVMPIIKYLMISGISLEASKP